MYRKVNPSSKLKNWLAKILCPGRMLAHWEYPLLKNFNRSVLKKSIKFLYHNSNVKTKLYQYMLANFTISKRDMTTFKNRPVITSGWSKILQHPSKKKQDKNFDTLHSPKLIRTSVGGTLD